MTAIKETVKEKDKDGDKGKKEKYVAPTRVVIRRLPPSMTKEEFQDQVSPLPDHDHLRSELES